MIEDIMVNPVVYPDVPYRKLIVSPWIDSNTPIVPDQFHLLQENRTFDSDVPNDEYITVNQYHDASVEIENQTEIENPAEIENPYETTNSTDLDYLHRLDRFGLPT